MIVADSIKLEQELSFNNLASKLGLTQQELVNAMKTSKIAMLERRLTITRDSVIGELDEELFDFERLNKIESIDGIIELSRYLNKSYQDVVITAIGDLFPAFEDVGLFEKEKLFEQMNAGDHDLQSFLQAIPIVTLFENDRGPYVTRLNREGITYVVRNEHMDLIFEHLLVPLVINSTTFQSKEKAEQFYESYTFKRITELHRIVSKINKENVIMILQDEQLIKIDPLFEKGLSVHFYGMMLYWSMQYFINFHEYSHVLCNHFTSHKDSISMEIEADNFALNALYYNSFKQLQLDQNNYHEEKDYQTLLFMVVSPLWIFLFFSVNNIESGVKISDSHPHPLLRLGNAYKTLDHLSKNHSPLNKGLKSIFKFIEQLLKELHKNLSDEQLRAIYDVDHYTRSPRYIYESKNGKVEKIMIA